MATQPDHLIFAPQLAPRPPPRQPPSHRPAPRRRRASGHPTPTAAAQNGGRSTGILRPLPHPAMHPPPATRHRSRRQSSHRRPTPPAVGGLRPPSARWPLGAGGEPRTRPPSKTQCGTRQGRRDRMSGARDGKRLPPFFPSPLQPLSPSSPFEKRTHSRGKGKKGGPRRESFMFFFSRRVPVYKSGRLIHPIPCPPERGPALEGDGSGLPARSNAARAGCAPRARSPPIRAGPAPRRRG